MFFGILIYNNYFLFKKIDLNCILFNYYCKFKYIII